MPDVTAEVLGLYRAGDAARPENSAYGEALQLADQAVGEGVATFEMLNVVWHIRFLRGDYAEAIEDLRRALVVRPESANAHYNLGLVYAGMKDDSAVRRSFLRARDLAIASGDESLLAALEHEL